MLVYISCSFSHQHFSSSTSFVYLKIFHFCYLSKEYILFSYQKSKVQANIQKSAFVKEEKKTKRKQHKLYVFMFAREMVEHGGVIVDGDGTYLQHNSLPEQFIVIKH